MVNKKENYHILERGVEHVRTIHHQDCHSSGLTVIFQSFRAPQLITGTLVMVCYLFLLDTWECGLV